MLAAAIRSARPRGVAIIGQDQLRRQILHVRDCLGSPAVGYIDLSVRYALDQGLHVVIEGILYDDIYGDMLRRLVADHRGLTRCYRYRLSFAETVRRHHATKTNSDEFGEPEMRQWWRDDDPLTGIPETPIPAHRSLADTVQQILADSDWTTETS